MSKALVKTPRDLGSNPSGLVKFEARSACAWIFKQGFELQPTAVGVSSFQGSAASLKTRKPQVFA